MWYSSTLLILILYTTLTDYPSPKLIPWFVSDVTPPDFATTAPSLHSESFFPEPKADTTTQDAAAAALPNADAHQHLKTMVARWQSYLDSGVFSLSVPVETKLGETNDKV